jgi:hypothetical protein
MWTAGGFYRGNAARERIFKTESGKASFLPFAMLRYIALTRL